jgi:hypothetical protein
MRSKRYIAFFCALCPVALLTGCTLTTDRLPGNIPKGYVLFRHDESRNDRDKIDICQLQDGKEVHMGSIGMWNDRRRVACEPGQHTFVIRLRYGPIVSRSSVAERVQVEVKQGRTTPVSISLVLVGTKQPYGPWTYRYIISFNVEEALSIE